MTGTRLLTALAATVLGCAPLMAMAQAGRSVYFAGFAYTGNAADVSSTLPVTTRVLDDAGGAALNARLKAALAGRTFPGYTLVFDHYGTVGDADNDTALALSIDRETASSEQIGDQYKVLVELGTQALFFDFDEKQVLGAYPITLQSIDVMSHAPTPADFERMVRHLITGTDATSLVPAFANRLATIALPNPATRRLRVTHVDVSPEALKLAPAAYQASPDRLGGQVAFEFGKFLAENQHVALLPYSQGNAIGGAMAARFADGRVYQLQIPDADYAIALSLRGFKRIDQPGTAVGRAIVYGAFVDVSVTEPMSGKTYFNHPIKYGATKVVPVTQVNVDDWAASYETLLLLFDDFSKAIGKPDAGWAAVHLGDRNARNDLTHLKELIEQCR
ncbi:hypothetical protein [Cognatiluteimonas profundi]|uniref:hypothetical protein n=1 Tax=Cognatiluteimonas profundi TaxID=2594501 RepID=UPI00131AC08F|nr:hypothetical protein [Lysobacter profundi]